MLKRHLEMSRLARCHSGVFIHWPPIALDSGIGSLPGAADSMDRRLSLLRELDKNGAHGTSFSQSGEHDMPFHMDATSGVAEPFRRQPVPALCNRHFLRLSRSPSLAVGLSDEPLALLILIGVFADWCLPGRLHVPVVSQARAYRHFY